jgi:four helix bundle suffix protein
MEAKIKAKLEEVWGRRGRERTQGGEENSQMSGSGGSDEALHRHLRPSGGYRELHSFQVATVIYDATVSFCERFVDSRSRTRDQMVQAARSGRQNIAEGSRASATSSQTELRLVNVARASLDELLLDYEDHLRQNGRAQWAKDSPEAMAVRLVGKNQPDRTDPSDLTEPYRLWLAHEKPEIVANAIICLIHQANYLLDRQIHALEQQFVKQGGYSEQLAAARLREREQQARSDQADRSDQTSSPICPICGGIMAVRTARKGPRAGAQFWGCVKYPACKGTKPL